MVNRRCSSALAAVPLLAATGAYWQAELAAVQAP